MTRLQYIFRTRAFGLITGEVGAGKSTAVRALYDQVDRAQHQFVYIADSELNPRSFYRDVLGQLGMAAPFHGREAKRLFEATLLEGYRSHGRQPVIVLDEAQLLSPEMLQEIRFILEFHFDSASPISFVLVGQRTSHSVFTKQNVLGQVRRLPRTFFSSMPSASVTRSMSMAPGASAPNRAVRYTMPDTPGVAELEKAIARAKKEGVGVFSVGTDKYYALALQVKPDLTPDDFLKLALRTGAYQTVTHEGKTYRAEPFLQPAKLIAKLR